METVDCPGQGLEYRLAVKWAKEYCDKNVLKVINDNQWLHNSANLQKITDLNSI